MTKFFANLNMVLAAGLVLALAVIWCTSVPMGGPTLNEIFRWLHLFFGVTWIGLLYYFNFVQIPTMPKIPAELKPAVSKHIAPSALFFFRWGAAFTVLTGLIVAHLSGYLVPALTFADPAYRMIGIGMWLALIMAFNVWFVIWPAQQKALGLVEADDAAKAAAATRAMMFSRTNTLLSLAMFYCMVNANNG
ncbi:MAG: urate hydroxylase PuuD [Sphingomonadaceae bacterium]|jgi:uncharacterized membrane protein